MLGVVPVKGFMALAAVSMAVVDASRHLFISAATGDATAAYPAELDDHACTFDWTTKSCTPAKFCSYQFQFGDTTFSQACRLVPDTFAKVPQQVHLAYAGAAAGTGMTLSWTTYAEVEDAAVWLGDSASTLKLVDKDVKIQVKTYYKDDTYHLYNHHATVTGLKPHTKYFYKVGSQATAEFQSEVSAFTTARAPSTSGEEETYTIAVYGDLGVDANANATLDYVNAKLPGKVDFIFHVGDISYADNAFLSAEELIGFYYEETYNRWMNSLTPTMKTLPYMVTVGNHEAECHSPACFFSGTKKDQLGNYTAYNARFKMPSSESGGVQNMWYSFNHGPIHFTSISSETDYANAPKNSVTGRKYGAFGDQLAWLEADLKKADANRDSTPWLVVSMHRAMYTRTASDSDGNPTKEPKQAQKAFEALFIKYKVDMVLSGHVHMYERHLPIKEGKAVTDGVSADKKTYTNPKAPVYLVTGAGGNTEGHDGAKETPVAWNAVVDNKHYGISLVQVSRNSLKWKFVATDSDTVLDEFAIVRS